MVQTRYTINRTCIDHHAGHSTRREETRQTKEMLARQHQGMNGAASRQDPETNGRQRRLQEDRQNICGAPTAPQKLRDKEEEEDKGGDNFHLEGYPDIKFNSFLTTTRTFSVMIGTLLHGFGSGECNFEPTTEM